jgi:flagellar biosynthesis protein FlhB
MEETDKESKTEAPTEKRLNDSLEEGNVPVSRELATAASMLAICVLYLLNGDNIARGITSLLVSIIESTVGSQPISNQDFLSLFYRLCIAIAMVLAPFFGVLMVTAIVSSIAQNEPRFVAKRITPQFSRISPAAGWKRLFSMKSLMEFLKSFIKIVGAIIIVVIAMKPTLNDMFRTMYQLPMTSLISISGMVAHLLVWVTGVSIFIAIIDFIWQRYVWWADLKMSRHELKEEFKQSEGDPIVKSRLRSIGRDRARSRMMQAVPTATLIIANPTHFAVALRYDRERDAAPIVVAKGADLIALRIRALAEDSGVPIFERVELARALYKVVRVDQIIPMQFYKALAELIRAVYDKRDS